jgi:predicted phage terminase large subunit-like protein
MSSSTSPALAASSDDLLIRHRLLEEFGDEAALCASSLREFIPVAWPIIEPGKTYKGNWHIDAIAEHAEAVTRREISQLVVNIPPRHMKSSLLAVLWPMWEWLTVPERQWLFVTYGANLSKRDSLKSRRLVESRGGRREGGTLIERVGYAGLLSLIGQDWKLAGDQNEKMRFENTRTGYRLATSFGGTATGEGGDTIVVDDPHKADEVESEVQRLNVIDFLDGTLSTRLNDPNEGAVVLIMQRLHEEDATGHMLAEGGWEHLCLPAEYEPSHPFVWPDDPRTEPGELLWPDHFTASAIERLKVKLGSYRAAGQLQQRPAPAEGGIFKTAWWQYYDTGLLDFEPGQEWQGPAFSRLLQSWDTALKEKTTSDFTVGQLWGVDGPNRYLLREVRGRWGLTDMTTQAVDLHSWASARWPKLASHGVFVENAALGPELMAALRKRIQGVIAVNVDRDKVSRAEAITPQLEAGNVFVPGDRVMSAAGWTPCPTRTPAWVQELIAECAAFPNAANDDRVDALTQALDPRRLGAGRKLRTGGQTITSGVRARGT